MENLQVKLGVLGYEQPDPAVREVRTFNFDVVTAQTTAQHNTLITEALRLATGDHQANPYDYLNRLSKRAETDGGLTVFLDGSAIIYIGPVRSEQDGRTLTVTTPYRFIGA